MDTCPGQPSPLDALARSLATTGDRIAAEVAICTTTVAELRRQQHALAKRRGGPGSKDARKYAQGAALVMVGCEDIDDTAMVGLFAHPDRMARWMTIARVAGVGPMLGDVIRWIFEDPAKLAWCAQWGRILQWRYRKPLYDAEVARFERSGKLGEHEPWRRKPVTIGQEGLMQTLADILGEPIPEPKTRGEAFEWIRERAGNPTYWQEPALPPILEENHDCRR